MLTIDRFELCFAGAAGAWGHAGPQGCDCLTAVALVLAPERAWRGAFAPTLSLTRELIFNAFSGRPDLLRRPSIIGPASAALRPAGWCSPCPPWVVLSVGVTTLGCHYLAHWSWPAPCSSVC